MMNPMEVLKQVGSGISKFVQSIDLKKAGKIGAGVAGIAGATLLTIAGSKAIEGNAEYTEVQSDESDEQESIGETDEAEKSEDDNSGDEAK